MFAKLFQAKEIKAALSYLNDVLALKMQEEGLAEPFELVRQTIENKAKAFTVIMGGLSEQLEMEV